MEPNQNLNNKNEFTYYIQKKEKTQKKLHKSNFSPVQTPDVRRQNT